MTCSEKRITRICSVYISITLTVALTVSITSCDAIERIAEIVGTVLEDKGPFGRNHTAHPSHSYTFYIALKPFCNSCVKEPLVLKFVRTINSILFAAALGRWDHEN